MKIPSFSKHQNDDFYNDQLSQTLQAGLSDKGWTPPVQTTESINTSAQTMPGGTFWVDSDTNKVVFKMTDDQLYSVDMTLIAP